MRRVEAPLPVSANPRGCLLMLGWTAHALDADEIVTRHTEALGGKAKLAALQSLRLVGKISFGSGDFSIDLAWTALLKGPGMIREEASLQGLTGVSAYDGKEGWQVQPFQGRKEPEHSSRDDSKDLAQRADFEGPLVSWKEKGFSLVYLGSEDVDGTDALKLKLTRPSGDFENVFLDPNYFLVIRSEKHNFIRGTEQIGEIDYGNYEQVAGVWIPFAIESGGKSEPRSQRLTIERAEPNARFEDAPFHFPKTKDAVRSTPARLASTRAPSAAWARATSARPR